jgi:hypothetical protein
LSVTSTPALGLTQDPKWQLCTFITDNFSSSNPTLTQMSGRILTAPTERPFIAPSILIGPVSEAIPKWSGYRILEYHLPVPVTCYSVYDNNPKGGSTTEQTAKIQRWNMLAGVRNLIASNKNLSRDGGISYVYNGGYREVNLTKWRPNVLGIVTIVNAVWLENLGGGVP